MPDPLAQDSPLSLQPIPPQRNVYAQQQAIAQAGTDVLGGVTGITDAVRAWRGEMTEEEQRNFALAGAAGLLPVGKGVGAAAGAAHLLPAIFAGPAAKTADLAALKIAQVMETRGETPEAIWKATGWFRGSGDKWRFEIPDKSMQLKVPQRPEGEPMSVGEAVQHKQLFEAYPQLQTMPLQTAYAPLSKKRGGLTGEGELILNTGYPKSEQRSTTLHELQHGVQDIEGFPPGGSPSTGEAVRAADLEIARRNQMAEAVTDRLRAQQQIYIDSQLAAGRSQDDYTLIAREFWRQNPELKTAWDAAYDQLVFGDAGQRRNQLIHQAYQSLAGEVESRNVQARRGMSAAERLKVPPWKTEEVPLGRQIIRATEEPGQPRLPQLEVGQSGPALELSPERQKYPGIVSTRAPWAEGRGAQKGMAEDPHSNILISDYHSFIAHPDFAEKNMAMVREPFTNKQGVVRYPQFLPSDFSGNTQEDALRFLQFQTDNLRVFGEGFHRAFGDEAVARARLWYPGANRLSRELAAKYGMTDTSAAAAYATRSPQMAWQSNVALTDRTAEVYFEHARRPWTTDMQNTLERIYPDFKMMPSGRPILGPDGQPQPTIFRALKDQLIGKRLADFPVDTDPTNLTLRSMWIRAFSETYHPREYALVLPEGVRARVMSPRAIQWSTNEHISDQLLAMDAKGDMRQIAEALGGRHKVRNFYNDIYMPDNPFGTVTGDTHYAAGANFLALSGQDMEAIHLMAKPPSHGLSGGWGIYGLSTEAARSLGKRWGWRPNETQSVTWEGARAVFTPEWKHTGTNTQTVRDLWRNGRAVGASDDEIRQKILEFAGGFKRPIWLDIHPE